MRGRCCVDEVVKWRVREIKILPLSFFATFSRLVPFRLLLQNRTKMEVEQFITALNKNDLESMRKIISDIKVNNFRSVEISLTTDLCPFDLNHRRIGA